MLTSLRIEGFKGFREIDFPELSRITLLGGRNNAGKTSLLEALFMFFDRMNPQMILRQFAWRGVGVIPLEPEAMWAPIFSGYDLDRPIVLSAIIDGAEERMTITYDPKYVPPTIQARPQMTTGTLPQIRTDQQPLPSYALEIRFTEKNGSDQVLHLLMGPEGVGLHIDRLTLRKVRPATFLSAKLHSNPQEDAARFGQLDVVGKQDSVLEFLRIIEPRLKGLTAIALGDTTMIHGDVGLGRKIPISYMGDGVSRMLSVILAIATTRNGIVLIDEFENGIHYAVMSKIWEGIGKAAREFDCQVIATTHSYECLTSAYQGLAGETEADFRYVRIDRIDDRAVAKTFDYELLRTAIDANMEVR